MDVGVQSKDFVVVEDTSEDTPLKPNILSATKSILL